MLYNHLEWAGSLVRAGLQKHALWGGCTQSGDTKEEKATMRNAGWSNGIFKQTHSSDGKVDSWPSGKPRYITRSEHQAFFHEGHPPRSFSCSHELGLVCLQLSSRLFLGEYCRYIPVHIPLGIRMFTAARSKALREVAYWRVKWEERVQKMTNITMDSTSFYIIKYGHDSYGQNSNKANHLGHTSAFSTCDNRHDDI